MQSSLFIIAAVSFIGLSAIFGIRKAPGMLLGVAATLSAVWIVATILTA